MAFWLQSEPITFSCCTRLGPHFSFIHWRCRAVPLPLFYFPTSSSPSLSLPKRRSVSEENFKMRLDARWNIRDSIRMLGVEGDMRHAHVHVDAHAHCFALSTKSLLQKGKSGQKTGGLITLIKSHFNILPLQRGSSERGKQQWRRNKMSGKRKIRWNEWRRHRERGGNNGEEGGQRRKKADKSLPVFML